MAASFASTAQIGPPRVVLDTNTSLALFAWVDARCAALLQALHARRLQAVACGATRGEWLRILASAQLRLDADCRARAALAFDTWVIEVAAPLPQPAPGVLPRCRDPDDQMFLELAHASAAIALYTRDRELLKLSRRTQRLAGFAVLRPEDFVG